ncbi:MULTISPECIES: hypothetical protein [unclassified Streptomyces]|uniref:hypothetical protein n=1 Tax=unclassified Streptomyces TaxID=2593676 RepID=UPI001F081AA9|nr:hypothetical protein [Streptomyces sp. CB09001]
MTWVTAGNTASTENTARTDAGYGGVAVRRTRRSVRAAVLALGLVGALALTACTDGGDSDGGGSGEGPGGGDKSSAAPGASASTDPGDDTGGSPSAGAGGELEGSWLATTDGQAVALMVTGDRAALFATGGTVCSGTTEETSGTRTIRLKCADGSAERATGKVGAVDATSLTVAWEGELGEETYTRSEGGSLPPGLPTTGIGS